MKHHYLDIIMTRDVKCEAMKRLKILQKQGLDGTVLPHYDKLDEVFFSDHLAQDTAVHAQVSRFAELQLAVDEVEALYRVHVYYVALCRQGLSPIAEMLFVEADPSEWEFSRRLLEKGLPWAFGYDLDTHWIQDSNLRYQFIDGCLVRTR